MADNWKPKPMEYQLSIREEAASSLVAADAYFEYDAAQKVVDGILDDLRDTGRDDLASECGCLYHCPCACPCPCPCPRPWSWSPPLPLPLLLPLPLPLMPLPLFQPLSPISLTFCIPPPLPLLPLHAPGCEAVRFGLSYSVCWCCQSEATGRRHLPATQGVPVFLTQTFLCYKIFYHAGHTSGSTTNPEGGPSSCERP